MNGMLATYESTLIESYSEGRQDTNKKNRNSRAIPQSPRQRGNEDHYKIFDAVENADISEELDNLPSKMKNPFSNMRRWLKFELLDLRSILQAIEKKNEMDHRR